VKPRKITVLRNEGGYSGFSAYCHDLRIENEIPDGVCFAHSFLKMDDEPGARTKDLKARRFQNSINGVGRFPCCVGGIKESGMRNDTNEFSDTEYWDSPGIIALRQLGYFG